MHPAAPRRATARRLSPKSACAAWMPYQIHERPITPAANSRSSRATARVTVDRRLAPCSKPSTAPGDPGRGMPLLAPVRAILREPLLDQYGRYGPITERARFSFLRHRRWRHGRQIFSFARYLRTVGLLTCGFPRDRRDGIPRSAATTDRTVLGHASHNPFRSFLAEIQHHPVKTIPWSACSA